MCILPMEKVYTPHSIPYMLSTVFLLYMLSDRKVRLSKLVSNSLYGSLLFRYYFIFKYYFIFSFLLFSDTVPQVLRFSLPPSANPF